MGAKNIAPPHLKNYTDLPCKHANIHLIYKTLIHMIATEINFDLGQIITQNDNNKSLSNHKYVSLERNSLL